MSAFPDNQKFAVVLHRTSATARKYLQSVVSKPISTGDDIIKHKIPFNIWCFNDSISVYNDEPIRSQIKKYFSDKYQLRYCIHPTDIPISIPTDFLKQLTSYPYGFTFFYYEIDKICDDLRKLGMTQDAVDHLRKTHWKPYGSDIDPSKLNGKTIDEVKKLCFQSKLICSGAWYNLASITFPHKQINATFIRHDIKQYYTLREFELSMKYAGAFGLYPHICSHFKFDNKADFEKWMGDALIGSIYASIITK